MCVEDSHSYLSELMQKVPKKRISFAGYSQQTVGGGGGPFR